MEKRIRPVQGRPTSGDMALSLGQQVRNHVLSRIESGEWAEGSRIPSEAKLVEQLGMSRMTVHIALRDLSAEGVLLRKQGAGTFVAPRRSQSTFLELRNIHTEIESRGNRHTTNVLTLESLHCSMTLATEMNIPAGSEVFHSVLVHFENGTPIQVEDRYVNMQFSPDYLEQDFTETTPNEHLMAAGALEEVEHVIQAIPAEESIAELLQMEAGTPVLLLRRRTWSRGMIATSVRLLHPGARFSLAGRMTMTL
ncbi:histidine utilization repressor [Pararhodobacter sp.]|uniref:histidine utilization repressor n=1 Tax=Pararhodobacter sp. TaxID=2127056 RepID=UPI002AFE2D9D|nr:histidine utilization repressor [Pararhodobacter sp.]